jgi:hypothetical protein
LGIQNLTTVCMTSNSIYLTNVSYTKINKSINNFLPTCFDTPGVPSSGNPHFGTSSDFQLVQCTKHSLPRRSEYTYVDPTGMYPYWGYELGLLSLIHTYHAVPMTCRADKGLDCFFHIWFTQCGRVWFTHAMPRPRHATTTPFWKRFLKATAQRGMGTALWIRIGRPETACGRPAPFGFFGLPRGIPRRLLSEAYQYVKL